MQHNPSQGESDFSFCGNVSSTPPRRPSFPDQKSSIDDQLEEGRRIDPLNIDQNYLIKDGTPNLLSPVSLPVDNDLQRCFKANGRTLSCIASVLPVAGDDGNFCGKKFSKERVAWYGYDVANSIFGGLAMSILVPIFLVKLAEVKAFGTVNPECSMVSGVQCDSEQCLVGTELFPRACNTCIVGRGQRAWSGESMIKQEGTVPFIFGEVDYVSFSMYVISLSVISQALAFMSLGSFADFGSYRKRLLVVSAFLGSILCSLFFFLGFDDAYMVAAILVIVSPCVQQKKRKKKRTK